MASKYTNLIADMRHVAIQLSEMPEQEFVSFSKQVLGLFDDPITPNVLIAQVNSGDTKAQKIATIVTVLSAISANFLHQHQPSKPVPISQKQLPFLN